MAGKGSTHRSDSGSIENVPWSPRLRVIVFRYSAWIEDSDLQHDYMLYYIREETLSRLNNAINSLPENLREIFDLCFEDGLKISEIAARLDLAEITIKKRKARLIDTLRRLLGNDFAFIAPFLL